MKKDDDLIGAPKNLSAYFATLMVDFLFILIPMTLFFTVSSFHFLLGVLVSIPWYNFSSFQQLSLCLCLVVSMTDSSRLGLYRVIFGVYAIFCNGSSQKVGSCKLRSIMLNSIAWVLCANKLTESYIYIWFNTDLVRLQIWNTESILLGHF